VANIQVSKEGNREVNREVNRTARLLVVDDDPLILVTLARGLRRVGYDVVEAQSGEEAVEVFRQAPFHLGIFDLRMPGISGIEAARRINSEARLPFIVLSAYDEAKVVDEAAEAGALGYLVKPVEVRQVVPTIEVALRRAAEMALLRESETQLSAALNQTRDISVAIGMVMERLQLSREAAFGHLRSQARSQRRKLADLAHNIVVGSEEP
jgi:response regulator NasT